MHYWELSIAASSSGLRPGWERKLAQRRGWRVWPEEPGMGLDGFNGGGCDLPRHPPSHASCLLSALFFYAPAVQMRSKWGAARGCVQRPSTTWATGPAQMAAKRQKAQEESWPSNKLFSRGDPLSQAPKGLGPRLGTFGTFGLEGRSPRHHLLALLWGQAWVGRELSPSFLS